MLTFTRFLEIFPNSQITEPEFNRFIILATPLLEGLDRCYKLDLIEQIFALAIVHFSKLNDPSNPTPAGRIMSAGQGTVNVSYGFSNKGSDLWSSTTEGAQVYSYIRSCAIRPRWIT